MAFDIEQGINVKVGVTGLPTLEDLRNKLYEMGATGSQIDTVMKTASGSTEAFSKVCGELGVSATQAAPKVKEVGDAVEATGKRAKDAAEGHKTFSKSLLDSIVIGGNWERTLLRAGVAMAGFSLLAGPLVVAAREIGVAIRDAIKNFEDIQAAMAKLQVTFATGAFGGNAEELKSLASNLHGSTAEMLKFSEAMLVSSHSTEELKNVLPTISQFAEATGEKLPAVAKDFQAAIEGNVKSVASLGVVLDATTKQFWSSIDAHTREVILLNSMKEGADAAEGPMKKLWNTIKDGAEQALPALLEELIHWKEFVGVLQSAAKAGEDLAKYLSNASGGATGTWGATPQDVLAGLIPESIGKGNAMGNLVDELQKMVMAGVATNDQLKVTSINWDAINAKVRDAEKSSITLIEKNKEYSDGLKVVEYNWSSIEERTRTTTLNLQLLAQSIPGGYGDMARGGLSALADQVNAAIAQIETEVESGAITREVGDGMIRELDRVYAKFGHDLLSLPEQLGRNFEQMFSNIARVFWNDITTPGQGQNLLSDIFKQIVDKVGKDFVTVIQNDLFSPGTPVLDAHGKPTGKIQPGTGGILSGNNAKLTPAQNALLSGVTGATAGIYSVTQPGMTEGQTAATALSTGFSIAAAGGFNPYSIIAAVIATAAIEVAHLFSPSVGSQLPFDIFTGTGTGLGGGIGDILSARNQNLSEAEVMAIEQQANATFESMKNSWMKIFIKLPSEIFMTALDNIKSIDWESYISSQGYGSLTPDQAITQRPWARAWGTTGGGSSQGFTQEVQNWLTTGLPNQINEAFWQPFATALTSMGVASQKVADLKNQMNAMDPKAAIQYFSDWVDALLAFQKIPMTMAQITAGLSNGIQGFNWQNGGNIGGQNQDTFSSLVQSQVENLANLGKAIATLTGQDQVDAANQLGQSLNSLMQNLTDYLNHLSQISSALSTTIKGAEFNVLLDQAKQADQAAGGGTANQTGLLNKELQSVQDQINNALKNGLSADAVNSLFQQAIQINQQLYALNPDAASALIFQKNLDSLNTQQQAIFQAMADKAKDEVAQLIAEFQPFMDAFTGDTAAAATEIQNLGNVTGVVNDALTALAYAIQNGLLTGDWTPAGGGGTNTTPGPGSGGPKPNPGSKFSLDATTVSAITDPITEVNKTDSGILTESKQQTALLGQVVDALTALSRAGGTNITINGTDMKLSDVTAAVLAAIKSNPTSTRSVY
jgi:hypothetical protein